MVLPTSAIVRPETRSTVAIVDDSPAALMYLGKILSERYQVRANGEAPEALAEIFRDPPDIVVLDVEMPEMNGYEMARQLKSNPATQRIPIIFISGQGDELDKVKAFTCGGVDYITKPFHTEETIARIETHVTMSRLRRKSEDANRILLELNGSLEKRVRKRTFELEQLNMALRRFVPQESLGFLSKESVAHIRRGDHIQKEMTILVADIRSFTELSEKMTPQENFDFINAYLNHVGPPITEHGGFIDKYIGDGIMAVFPNDPRDAVEAAFAMQSQVRNFNEIRAARGKPTIRVGIGMHRGHVMFGTVGHPERLDVTVISDAVNLAFRMQDLTKKFHSPIIASEPTVEMLLGATTAPLRHRFLGLANVKGKVKPVCAYAIQPRDPPYSFHWMSLPDSAGKVV